jgi:hypothetical protein
MSHKRWFLKTSSVIHKPNNGTPRICPAARQRRRGQLATLRLFQVGGVVQDLLMSVRQ